jgi:hypothetical protein
MDVSCVRDASLQGLGYLALISSKRQYTTKNEATKDCHSEHSTCFRPARANLQQPFAEMLPSKMQGSQYLCISPVMLNYVMARCVSPKASLLLPKRQNPKRPCHE